MSRFDPDPPATVGEVNARLVDLANELERLQPTLEGLLAEQQKVSLRYELEYAATVKTSQLGSEDRRKAEAVTRLYETYLDDSPVDLATRRADLEMRVKAMREAAHNIRAQISGLQSVGSNIRAEMSLGGAHR